jgi:hypothetical protein
MRRWIRISLWLAATIDAEFAMIDFIALKIDHNVAYSPEFQVVKRQHERVWNRLRGNNVYNHVIDLHSFGLNAILYTKNRFDGTDRLELTKCGFMGAKRIEEEFGKIVADPLSLQVQVREAKSRLNGSERTGTSELRVPGTIQ